MPTLRIALIEEDEFADLVDKEGNQKPEVVWGELVSVVYRQGMMQSGEPGVTLRIKLPDGKTVLANTGLVLFDMANSALRGRQQREQDLEDDVHGSGRGSN